MSLDLSDAVDLANLPRADLDFLFDFFIFHLLFACRESRLDEKIICDVSVDVNGIEGGY